MRPILQACGRNIPAFRRYLFRSAGTLSSPELKDGLNLHIANAGEDPKASFVPVLEKWKQQGNHLNPSDLRSIIQTLRDSERFPQALKVSEWMSEQKVCNLIPEDYVSRLHLIDNVLEDEEARVPVETVSVQPHDVSLQNNQIGKRDMVHQILSQMEKNNVKSDNRTLKIILGLLAECDTSTLDWRTSCEMAKTYLKQGLVVEAVKMLRRAEESVVDPDSKKLVYESLMVLYGEAGKAEEVYRIWGLYNNMSLLQRVADEEGYKAVITALLKLNDINGASTIVNKWYGKDVRIITMMASAYCEKGQLKDAEELLFRKGFRFVPKKIALALVVCYGYMLYDLGVKLYLGLIMS
ncbi:unnamed protein product [Arabidopsis halleri]